MAERDDMRKQLKASLAEGHKLCEKLQSLQAGHKVRGRWMGGATVTMETM